MSTYQYTGNMIPALMARTNYVLQSYVRQSSVDGMNPWPILTSARLHLCAHVMTAGDVQAWYLLADIHEQAINEELTHLNVLKQQCEASVGGGENPPQCQKAATVGRYCDEHYEE